MVEPSLSFPQYYLGRMGGARVFLGLFPPPLWYYSGRTTRIQKTREFLRLYYQYLLLWTRPLPVFL